MYRLVVQTHIDAAHYLPDYKGKCSQMHGHRWEIVVAYVFPDLKGSVGMLVDFARIKEVVHRYDHQTLNDFLTNPTAENLAYHIWTLLPRYPDLGHDLTVEVWESPDSMVSYTEWEGSIDWGHKADRDQLEVPETPEEVVPF